MCHLAQDHRGRFYKTFLSDSAEPNAIGHDDMGRHDDAGKCMAAAGELADGDDHDGLLGVRGHSYTSGT
jgi:hypothetical protein